MYTAMNQSDFNDQLWIACNQSNLAKVKGLLKDNPQLSVIKVDTDEFGFRMNALHYAANTNSSGDPEGEPVVEIGTLLLARSGGRALVNSQDIDLSTPLHYSCLRGNVPMSMFLMENGADLNLLGYGGKSVMHNACRCGSLELVNLLIRKNVSVYLMNNEGQTPLDLCDNDEYNNMRIDRQTVELTFIHQQNWSRRKHWAQFLNLIYGSAKWQASQLLLPPDQRTARAMPVAWTVYDYDKVLSIRGLRDLITSYL